MTQVLRTRAGLFLVLAVGCASLLVAFSKQDPKPAVDPETYKALMAAQVSDIHDLEDFFFEQRDQYLAVLPPDPHFILRQPGCPDMLPFWPKSFPAEFVKDLVPAYENTVPVYPITILEDPETRETVFLNADGREFYAVPSVPGYDPYSFVKWRYPSLYSGFYSKDWVAELETLYDPARIQILVRLIPVEYVEQYLYAAARLEEEQAKQTQLLGGKAGGGMRLLGMEEYSNHLWLSIQGPAQGLPTPEVTAHMPPEFTNQIEIFTATNLLDFWWTLAVTNISTAGTDQYVWADSSIEGTDVRFYALANADVDSDSDDLADGREKFVYHTNPNLADTDGDGASDGDEVAHDLNPLNNPGDSDNDGLSDDLETVLGTDPDAADTDLDWAGDGYEQSFGSDPLDSSNAPPLRMEINANALYSRSTNLFVNFPGLVAEHAVIAETQDLTNGVVRDLATNLAYGLQNESNGARQVFARLYRNSVEQSPLLDDSIIFDNTAPTLGNFCPTNGFSTNRRWIKITGIATDTFSAARVFVNGQWSDGMSQGVFQYDRFMLTPWTNHVEITAEDTAGNVGTQYLEVIQDTTGDTTAPSIALELPTDYVVNAGVTNWLDQTTVGAAEDLYAKGGTDDETADIRLVVVGADQTNGPFSAVVTETQVWGTVRLFPGTNTLTALASDAAGNTSTGIYTVIRDTNFFFEITYPSAYQVMNSPSTLVYGVASPQFSNAMITINGVATEITDQGSNVAFATTTAVPLAVGLTELLGEAQLSGRSYHCDPPPAGYEIPDWRWNERGQWEEQWHHDCSGYAGPSDQLYSDNWHVSAEWDADSRLEWHHTDQDSYDRFVYCNDDVVEYPYNVSTSTVYSVESPPTWLWFGPLSEDYAGQDEWGATWSGASTEEQSSELGFVKQGPSQETQLVVFQFPGLHMVSWNFSPQVNPSEITYRGQTGFWFNGNVSFVVPVRTRVRYTISESDFTWPETHWFGWNEFWGGYTLEEGHMLYAAGFSNCQIRVVCESERAANSAKEFKFGKTTVESPCAKTPDEAEALIVYYNEVFDYDTKQVQDFDVALKVLPDGVPGVQWAKVSGPQSGTLLNPAQSEATFRNPTKGGVYQFDAALASKTTRAQLWHPVACPEIETWLQNEFAYLQSWTTNYLANAELSRRMPLIGVAFRAWDLFALPGITLDWTGYFTAVNSPCVPFQALNEFSINPRHTICGIVIDRFHLSNLLTAYLARGMTGWTEDNLLWQFNKAGNPDDEYDVASYRIGFAVFNGASVQDAMHEWGYASQEPDAGNWTFKLWPSEETPTAGEIHRPQALQ